MTRRRVLLISGFSEARGAEVVTAIEAAGGDAEFIRQSRVARLRAGRAQTVHLKAKRTPAAGA